MVSQRTWVSGRESARILEVNPRDVPAIAEAANIRRRVLPGKSPRYHRGDLKKLARECVIGQPRK